MAAAMGGAALLAVAGLMGSLMQQQAARDAAKEANEQAQRQLDWQKQQARQQRLAQAQDNQLSTVRSMGDREQNALTQLMAALARTQR